LLELCAGVHKKITIDLVNDVLGVGGRDKAERVVRAIAKSDFEIVFETVEEVVRSSKDITVFLQDVISFYRDMLVVRTTSSAKKYLDLTDDEYEKLSAVASLFSKETLLYHCRVLDETATALPKVTSTKRTLVEMAFVRICDTTLDDKTDAILSRIAKLENAIAAGTYVQRENAPQKSEPQVEAVRSDDKAMTEESTPKTVENISAKASEKTLKALRGWNEIIEQASAGDDSLYGWLKVAKAFVDSNGDVYVRFPNEFSMKMALAKTTLKSDIRAAFCILLKKQLGDSNIHYGVFEGNESELEELDELNL
jgi:DNA polymerase-3 subunit gamma/tau